MFLSQLRARDWLQAASSRRVLSCAVVAVATVVLALMAQDKRAPKVAAGADAEVSSQAKRLARFAPTAAQWASLGIEPGQADRLPLRAHDRRQDLDQRGPCDADLSALCRARDPADGEAR